MPTARGEPLEHSPTAAAQAGPAKGLCRRAFRGHPLAIAAVGLAVATSAALLCVGLMRQHRR